MRALPNTSTCLASRPLDPPRVLRGHNPDVDAIGRTRVVNRAVAWLPSRDRKVIGLRFGLDGAELTLAEVGWLLQITAARVRQIQQRALLRLRRSARRTGLIDYAPAGQRGDC